MVKPPDGAKDKGNDAHNVANGGGAKYANDKANNFKYGGNNCNGADDCANSPNVYNNKKIAKRIFLSKKSWLKKCCQKKLCRPKFLELTNYFLQKNCVFQYFLQKKFLVTEIAAKDFGDSICNGREIRCLQHL